MKKILLTFFLVSALIFVPSWALAQERTIVIIDGQGHMFSPSPVIIDGRKLVPMRPLLEALGAAIYWDNDTNAVTGYVAGSKIHIPLEEYVVLVNYEEVLVDTPARLIGDSVFIPLRFVSEALGYNVIWNNATWTILITTPEFYQERYIIYSSVGIASWYGGRFHGRRTASGEVFDQYGFTAAHRTLPFGTLVSVTCTSTERNIQVRINDRGPHIPGRIIDLSMAAADAIGLRSRGIGEVRIEVLGEVIANVPEVPDEYMLDVPYVPDTPDVSTEYEADIDNYEEENLVKADN